MENYYDIIKRKEEILNNYSIKDGIYDFYDIDDKTFSESRILFNMTSKYLLEIALTQVGDEFFSKRGINSIRSLSKYLINHIWSDSQSIYGKSKRDYITSVYSVIWGEFFMYLQRGENLNFYYNFSFFNSDECEYLRVAILNFADILCKLNDKDFNELYNDIIEKVNKFNIFKRKFNGICDVSDLVYLVNQMKIDAPSNNLFYIDQKQVSYEEYLKEIDNIDKQNSDDLTKKYNFINSLVSYDDIKSFEKIKDYRIYRYIKYY